MSGCVSVNVTADIEQYAVGVDFGTLSGRAVVVRVADGREWAARSSSTGMASSTAGCPTAPARCRRTGHCRTLRTGARCCASRFRRRWQPAASTRPPSSASPPTSPPAPYCRPWPTAHRCARPKASPASRTPGRSCGSTTPRSARPTRSTPWPPSAARAWAPRYGGKQSSEWEFAKALQVLQEAPEVYERCERWIEAADWIVWELTGTESRNACTAGYKGIFQDGAYPSADFLAALDPRFADFAATRLDHPGGLAALGSRVGGLSAAGRAVDRAARRASRSPPATSTRTSPHRRRAPSNPASCWRSWAPRPATCSTARSWPTSRASAGSSTAASAPATSATRPGRARSATSSPGGPGSPASDHDALTAAAADQPVGGHGLIALDWMGGNRSILVDHDLSGVIVGLTLATRPEEVYRALLEATAFGTRVIVEAFEAGGVPVEEFVVAGGLKRNSFLMQLYADILRPPGLRGRSPSRRRRSARRSTPPSPPAPTRTCRPPPRRWVPSRAAAYVPDPARADAYDVLFAEYRALHDAFGRSGGALHRLRRIRNAALAPEAGPDRAEAAVRTGRRRAARAESRSEHRLRTAGLRPARRAGPLPARGVDRRQRLRARPRRGPVGHQAVRGLLRRADAGEHDRLRPGRQGRRGRPVPVLRHRRARLRLPAHARGRRRRAHPLHLRLGLGRARRGGAVRADRDGRRVRRRDPGRAVRADRRRLDRPRHRRDAGRQRSPAVLMRNHGVFTIGKAAPRPRSRRR